MSKSILQEIKQSRPFATEEIEAYVSLRRTSALFDQQVIELLKPYHLTPTQYNVLRILRGAGEGGLCRFEVRDRLIAPEPDVTRLLDRLEKLGLVTRRRDSVNRRLVKATITGEGLQLLEELEEPLQALHRTQFGHLGKVRLRSLIETLALARAPNDEADSRKE